MLPYKKELVKNAQVLRKNMTAEEKHIWYDFLKRLPYKVKRQYNIGNYIVDFYIAEKKTVIEIDGRQHLLTEGKKADAERDVELSKFGISVLRYSNESVKNNFNAVADDILKTLGLNAFDLKLL